MLSYHAQSAFIASCKSLRHTPPPKSRTCYTIRGPHTLLVSTTTLTPNFPPYNSLTRAPTESFRLVQMDPLTSHRASQTDAHQTLLLHLAVPSASIPWQSKIIHDLDTRYLLSVLQDANCGGKSAEERAAVPTHVAHPPHSKPQNKICQYWYRQGTCAQDDNSACPFLHELKPGLQPARLTVGLRKKHKQGYGLGLCPWKDEEPDRKLSMPTGPTKEAVLPAARCKQVCWCWYPFGDCTRHDGCSFDHKQGSLSILQMSPSAHGPHRHHGCGLDLCPWKDGMPAQAANVSTKRKGRDEPLTAKRSRLDYDDAPSRASKSTKVPASTVSWAQMYQVDSASVQLCVCTAWRRSCDMYLRARMLRLSSIENHCNRGISIAEQTASQKASNWKPTNNKNKQVKETCFFWYHDTCARSCDKSGCSFLHELTETPSIVQPPPGCKHKSPCAKPWCPGDAREVLILKDTAPQERAQTSGADGKYDSNVFDDCFLTGFDRSQALALDLPRQQNHW
ncbi:hypothetical protein DOTSEDRAFT_77063 [Dothistroma septosporum NZE10]|uniref:C3H1-type domain-containing protein n=1 Tax=Dothistroma septosporum (strain NZE10 / CBS 128990) TaxID=675120 RepID=N1Q2B3_DOTSN|nr:hypothetical protein DOTSEDRAFT_77063 [Dothistroma septosporum NZE10]